jgi:hypothetical protein
MKILLLLLVVCLAREGNAQLKRYDCEYCGYYEGISTKGDSGETNMVIVKLDLRSDSTYGYEIGGVFSGCTSMVFTGSGKWFADSAWIYFTGARANTTRKATGIVL